MKKKIFLFSSIAFLASCVDFRPVKAFDMASYWYGIGVGVTETLCYASLSGYMDNYSAKNMLETYRSNFSKNAGFDSTNFENGVQIAFGTYTSCRL